MSSFQDASQITAEQLEQVTRLLGREPRGLRQIMVFGQTGAPAVIRVASLVDGKPFPTLYWLIDSELCLRIDRMEASGCIAQLQTEVDESPELRARMLSDHRSHQRARDQFLSVLERQFLSAQGMLDALDKRGIGGIAEPDRIRCLHTWYAAHLVTPNCIGERLDAMWANGEYLAQS